MVQVFSIISLLIYFIWGQAFACAWWMWLIFGSLIFCVFTSKLPWWQIIASLFLIGVTWFGSPTFGYSKMQKAQYNEGFSQGRMAHNMGGISDSVDDWWEGHLESVSADIDGYKRYWVRGFKRGLNGKKD